ncbi:DUF6893 family small protein [Streptomyces sp. NPDC050560]
MKKTITTIALAGTAALIAANLPDIKRYLKLRAM